jgi:hypothetical protein
VFIKKLKQSYDNYKIFKWSESSIADKRRILIGPYCRNNKADKGSLKEVKKEDIIKISW